MTSSSALRPRELYNLKITDIDFKKGLLFIEQSKGEKDRIVPVGKHALHCTGKYLTEVRPKYIKENRHEFVFISHKTGEKLTVWGIRWAIRRTLEQSGFRPIKPYALRHTAATALLHKSPFALPPYFRRPQHNRLRRIHRPAPQLPAGWA